MRRYVPTAWYHIFKISTENLNNAFREYFTKEQRLNVRDQALKMFASVGHWCCVKWRKICPCPPNSTAKMKGIIMPAAGDDVEKEDHSGRTSREDHAGTQSGSFSQH